ncbi:MAG: hypothetical protein J7J72_05430 [Bacteroidales bacterium]|nr:hypothetical protein [Bacteroidales bacterium]
MKPIDAIFLSYSKTEELYAMTKLAIRSLRENNPDYIFNVCVVQTCDNKFGDEEYFDDESVFVVHPNKKFHFNDFLRYGYNEMPHSSDFILICNDDIYFRKGSVNELIKGTKYFEICSPKNPDSRYDGELQSKHKTGYIQGYTTSEHLSGFCHLINKRIFETIPIDIFWHTNFGGYFQDYWIAFLCKVNKIPIGLCADAIVDHNERGSWKNPNVSEIKYFSMRQKSIYNRMRVWYIVKKHLGLFGNKLTTKDLKDYAKNAKEMK